MKALQLLPLAYLADVHGFVFFAPYMLFVLLIAHLLAGARRRARKATNITEALEDAGLSMVT